MLEGILEKRGCSVKTKLTVKSLVALLVVALAVALPQIVHAFAGAVGGAKWLPMYLPVLLGGCLLGWTWGLGAGILSPVVSFLITLAAGNPMPALARLPFMAAELAVFGAVSGLFAKKISQNGWMAFPAVLLASVAGRGLFLLLALIFQSVTPFTPAAVWAQVQTGLLALVLQAVIVPFTVMGLQLILDRKHD